MDTNTSTNPVEDAYRLRDEIKAENARMEKNIAELKALEARRVLGGSSEAGQPTQQIKKELTPEEYARLALGGKIE